MAENQDDRSKEDLTEEASPHRVEEYRQKGIVAQSREISGLAALFATGITLYIVAPNMGTQLAAFMREVFRVDLSSRMDLGETDVARGLFMKALRLIVSVGLPVSIAGFVVGAISSFAQIGSIFSFEPLMPDFSKLNPLAGITRMFSIRQAVDGVRLTVKIIVAVFTAYVVLKTIILSSPIHISSDSDTVLRLYGDSAKSVFIAIMLVLTLFALMDFGLQRMEYSKNLRMTKQEAKQEHKEREGDPQIKARIRSVQREIARRRMMQAVKKADVVVTNPTHIAVALSYEKDKMAAPKVVAKGADFLAQRIKAIALEAGVPMVENVPLARTLYKSVKVGQLVPRALYQAVAEILAYVYRLKRKDQI